MRNIWGKRVFEVANYPFNLTELAPGKRRFREGCTSPTFIFEQEIILKSNIRNSWAESNIAELKRMGLKNDVNIILIICEVSTCSTPLLPSTLLLLDDLKHFNISF